MLFSMNSVAANDPSKSGAGTLGASGDESAGGGGGGGGGDGSGNAGSVGTSQMDSPVLVL